MSLLILPNELLLQIAESLPSEKDINALVRTNRLFHTLLNPYLYRHNILHHASDALVRAAELGSASATAKLLAAGANVNVKDRSGHPLLVKAAGMGRVEVVKVLVEHPGIDLNARGAGAGFSALNAALKHGRVDVAEVLIGTEGVDLVSRTNNERAPLSYAAMLPGSEGERTVRMLLDTGKVEVFTWDILSCTPWIIAAAKGNMGSLELLLEEVRKEISWEADDDGRPPWALDHTNNLDSIVEGLGAGISGMRLLWSLDMRTQLRDVFMSDRIPMPYSPEFYAPANIYLRPGNTLVPSRWMSTFQCAGIPTKIQRGTIVIPNEVHVSESGDKLGSSSFLFNILNVSTTVYAPDAEEKVNSDEPIESTSIIFIKETDMLQTIFTALENITGIAQAINYTVKPARLHSLTSSSKAKFLERQREREQLAEVKEGDCCCDSDDEALANLYGGWIR